MLKMTHLKATDLPTTILLVALLALVMPVLANADDQVFIQSISGTSVLFVTDIDNMYLPQGAVVDIPGRVDINAPPNGRGFDDGNHMVIDPKGGRIFVSDLNSDFAVFDFDLNLLSPTWGVSLDVPLGLAVSPNGGLWITAKGDQGGTGQEGLYRFSPNLTLAAAATGTSAGLFNGLEGIAYDAVHNRIYAGDENADKIQIFNATTLAYIGSAAASSTGDGPYWLAVDGSTNHLFVLFDSRSLDSNDYGIQVYDISGGGDTLTFNQTLVGSAGGSTNCIGSIAVSESRNRLFAVDQCADAVSVFDTLSLAPLASVPSSRSGNNPKMVAVGHLTEPVQPVPVPTLSQWGIILLITGLALAGLVRVRTQRSA